MITRAFVSCLVLTTVATTAPAQERMAYFDAAVVVADHTSRFQQLGDINGDGFMDAFSAWWVDDQYHQLRLKAFINDGEGKLVPTWTKFPSVSQPNASLWAFAAGDANADGNADLVSGLGPGVTLHVTGPGGGPPSASPSWTTTGSFVTGVALLDVDADGILEIAALSGDLTILKYTPGNSALAPIAVLALGAVGGELRHADVDGRGQGDILAWDATRTWLIPMQGSVPQPPTIFLHGCGDPRGAAGDIDNDGDEDVVMFDMGTYVVLRRTSPTTYAQEPAANGGPARFLYDLDGNGVLDGVCCGGGGPSPVYNNEPSIFRIAMNDGTGKFAPALEMPGMGSVRLAGAADLDHDGDLDLVAGRCVYYTPSNWHDGKPRTLPFVARSNAFADLEGDMDADLEPGTSTQRNMGNGQFAAFDPVLPPAPAGRTWTGPGFPGDFDGDGDLDLIVQQKLNGSFEQMELLKNAGGGSFSDAGAAGAPGVDFTYGWLNGPHPRDLLAKDADGDGDVDLVVLGRTTSYSKIYWNDGNGFFTAGPFWFASVLMRHVADMNGDGLPDLIGHRKDVNNDWDIVVYAGLGNGTFSTGYQIFFSDTHSGLNDAFDIGDADGDGDLDIVGCDSNDLYIFANVGQPGGALSFQYQLVLDRAVEGDTLAPRGAQFTDADMDGKLDIACWPVSWYLFDVPNGSIVMRRKTDNSGYEFASHQVLMPKGRLDLDGDGDEDFVSTHAFKNRHFENVEGGLRKQSSSGIPGLGGITPTLGASGPFRVGLQAQMVLTGAASGVQGLWFQHYLGETVPPFTRGGMNQAPIHLYYPPLHITTSGAPGNAGEGKWSLTFEVPSYVAGRTKVYHCDFYDQGAPAGISRTNKLFVTYGP